MANPAVADLNVYQGDRFELFFRIRSQVFDEALGEWVPGPYVDLTGQTAKGEIRVAKADAAPIATFSCALADQSDVDTVGGVLCTLLPTESIKLVDQMYYYDIQLSTGAAFVVTYLAGRVIATQEVTRNA